MEITLTDRFAALSHPTRLHVLRLLMRRHPDAVPAGEIASALGVKANTLSAYLAQLVRVGLITRVRLGTSLCYAADIDGIGGMTDALHRDCCRGRPDLCRPLSIPDRGGDGPMPDKKYNVLFICTGNSARSIFAESILRTEAGDRFAAFSAGTHPQPEPNPLAIEMLQSKGHDVGGLRSKDMSKFQTTDAPAFDFVFTVCDRAANEECPVWEGAPLTGHWSTPDPASADGSEAERMLAFQQAYGMLRHRITAFAALPIETLDRIALQSAMDDIARSEPSA